MHVVTNKLATAPHLPAPLFDSERLGQFEATQDQARTTLYEHVGQLVLTLEHGPNSATFRHMLGVAAVMDMAAGDAVDETTRTNMRLAGGLHDIFKILDPVIRELVNNGRPLNEEEFVTVWQHGPLAAEYIQTILDPEKIGANNIAAIATAIYRHHFDPEGDPLSAWLQIADRVHAVLIDPHRTYRAARMGAEGLLMPDGTPKLQEIRQELLHDPSETAFGIPLARIVDLGVALMPQPPDVAVDHNVTL
ncbi:MAG TPA: HD domain-containing protein [Candidatus Saccharimonadales bacterium]|nr:HD domain-containing protein [Candidatus Saccharimonadales bacterium]